MFENIPNELKQFRQWVVWRYEDNGTHKPDKMPYCPHSHKLADSTDSTTWSDFDSALNCFNSGLYSGIGFVLSEYDPYTIIDLDDPYELKADGTYKHKDPEEVMKKQVAVFNEFDSYSERSPSGKGLHIIIRASLPSGRRRSAIEIYSNLRFMTMTGDVYANKPVNEYNEKAQQLWQQLGKGKDAGLYYAGLEKATLEDAAIINMAATAKNAEKFNDLFFIGNWAKYYPSQSEADFALIDIIAFYSQNRAQTQKLFLQSALAQREKSRAQYRINYMLNRCFDNMLPPVDIEFLQNAIRDEIEENIKEKNKKSEIQQTPLSQPISEENPYTVPPGLVGRIAQFIYSQSPRPVAEIALVGAIGLMAGIVGRAFNVSGTGLNQYVLLLAPTGTGKEAIAGGIDKLMDGVLKAVPSAKDFLGPGEISSPQALLKYLSNGSPSFVSLVGEFGVALQNLTDPHAPAHLKGLLRSYLDLYNKSGHGRALRPLIYSDKEKNTEIMTAPNFCMIGESVPETFYVNLNESMILSGFLPRFNIFEYKGDLTDFNENHNKVKPDPLLVEQLATICAHAQMLNSQDKVVNVDQDEAAKNMLISFRNYCDENVRGAKEAKRQLWNRGHIKALKLAATIAIGINVYNPIIDANTAAWAINIVLADIRNILSRFDAGEIGLEHDETKQIKEVIRVVSDYCKLPWSEVEKYAKCNSALHSEKIIPFGYLQRRLAAVSVFKKDRRGSTTAIKAAITTLKDRGDITEVPRQTLSQNFNTSLLAYMIAMPKVFDL